MLHPVAALPLRFRRRALGEPGTIRAIGTMKIPLQFARLAIRQPLHQHSHAWHRLGNQQAREIFEPAGTGGNPLSREARSKIGSGLPHPCGITARLRGTVPLPECCQLRRDRLLLPSVQRHIALRCPRQYPLSLAIAETAIGAGTQQHGTDGAGRRGRSGAQWRRPR